MSAERVRYHIHTTVVYCKEHFETAYKESDNGKMEKVQGPSLGWFTQFEGSYEALFMGASDPGLKAGDKVHITFMKEE